MRSTLVRWVFFAAFAPASVVMVTTVLLLGVGEPFLLLGAVLGPLAVLAAISALFASIVARHVTVPLTRVRALAVLASRPQAEASHLLGAATREPYAETAAVLDALATMRRRATWEGQRRDQLAAFIAHDLRTPISAVAMRLAGEDDLQDRARLGGELRWVLSEVEQLVAALRDGAEVDRMDEPISAEVETLVRSLLPTLAGESGVAVELRVVRPFVAAMPPAAVRSVAQNLLSNAIRHAINEVVVEIALGVIEVRNDRRDADVTAGGDASGLQRHGLGLAIARHVLDAYGGRLSTVTDEERAYAVVAYMPVAGRRDSP